MPNFISNTGRPAGETSEARIAKALAHPLRARILQRLGERTASPGDLAVELNAPLGVVSYHVRMLRDYNCVELVRTEPVRGALQHFYKRDRAPELRRRAVAHAAVAAAPRARRRDDPVDSSTTSPAAADAGHLEDADVILTRTPLELDEKAFKKLNKLLAKTHEQVLAIAAESAERGGDDVFATELGLLHFKRAKRLRRPACCRHSGSAPRCRPARRAPSAR